MNRTTILSVGFVTAFTIAIVFGRGYENLVIASLVAFVSMTSGVYVGDRFQTDSPYIQSVLYGIGSGMMITSAFLIIAPKAMSGDAYQIAVGGLGISFGYMIGYTAHELGHILSHNGSIQDTLYSVTVFEISSHSILAGSLMGVAYASIPNLSLIFGFGVVAHKFPAGLTAGLPDSSNSLSLMLIPATLVGIAGVTAAALVPPLSGVVTSLVFGVSTGLFAHVAIDMTPECVGSEAEHTHGKIVCSTDTDRVRLVSSASVAFGGIIIAGLWYIFVTGSL